MIEYFQRYGFDKLTGIELQEETTSKLKDPSRMASTDLATNSFGQGIAITRLQLITAFNALANSGNLISPTLIKSIDGVPSSAHKEVSVISPETSLQLPESWSKPLTRVRLSGLNQKVSVLLVKPVLPRSLLKVSMMKKKPLPALLDFSLLNNQNTPCWSLLPNLKHLLGDQKQPLLLVLTFAKQLLL